MAKAAKKGAGDTPVAAVKDHEEKPPTAPQERAWVDYCPECQGRDIRWQPLGSISKTIGRLACGRCDAFEMKSNVFKEE